MDGVCVGTSPSASSLCGGTPCNSLHKGTFPIQDSHPLSDVQEKLTVLGLEHSRMYTLDIMASQHQYNISELQVAWEGEPNMDQKAVLVNPVVGSIPNVLLLLDDYDGTNRFRLFQWDDKQLNEVKQPTTPKKMGIFLYYKRSDKQIASWPDEYLGGNVVNFSVVGSIAMNDILFENVIQVDGSSSGVESVERYFQDVEIPSLVLEAHNGQDMFKQLQMNITLEWSVIDVSLPIQPVFAELGMKLELLDTLSIVTPQLSNNTQWHCQSNYGTPTNSFTLMEDNYISSNVRFDVAQDNGIYRLELSCAYKDYTDTGYTTFERDDGERAIDLFSSDFGLVEVKTNSIHFWELNQVSNSFTIDDAHSIHSNATIHAATILDVNMDGKMDIATAVSFENGDSGIMFWIQNENATTTSEKFEHTTFYSITKSTKSKYLHAVDLNNDGTAELIELSMDDPTQVEVIVWHKVHGIHQGTVIYTGAFANDIVGAMLAFGDVQNDGHVDLILQVGINTVFLLNQGGLLFNESPVDTSICELTLKSSVVPLDINRDGNLDLYCHTSGETPNIAFGPFIEPIGSAVSSMKTKFPTYPSVIVYL